MGIQDMLQGDDEVGLDAQALSRRRWLARCCALGAACVVPLWAGRAQAAPLLTHSASVQALQAGGVAVLIRHARTEPGVGDPPGFRLEACPTQRNLSEEGRAQSQRLGAWFRERSLRPLAVRSSRWCRCLDTATLAFGRVEPWPALDSFFEQRGSEPAQTQALREALRRIPARRFEVWVTHMVNVAALTGESLGMGEALVVRGGAEAPQNVGRLALPG